MRAFFAEENRIKRDEVALRQLHALKEHQGPREKKLRLSDVKRCLSKRHFEGRPRCRYCQIGTGNFSTPPALICKLLRAIAGKTDARRYRYDTTLIGAAETIEAFERETMAPTDLPDWL